jgi:hypothetical protein
MTPRKGQSTKTELGKRNLKMIICLYEFISLSASIPSTGRILLYLECKLEGNASVFKSWASPIWRGTQIDKFSIFLFV